jgi:hypothetical protein
VWGRVEYSLSAPAQNNQQQDQQLELSQSERRSMVYYHLSQLFPENEVASAMRSHPLETDPQRLCEHIISAKNDNNNITI